MEALGTLQRILQLHYPHLLLRPLDRSQIEQLVTSVLIGDLILQRIGQRSGGIRAAGRPFTLHRRAYPLAFCIVQRDFKTREAGQLRCQLASATLQKLLGFQPRPCIISLLHPQIDGLYMLGERCLCLAQLVALNAAQHEIAQHADRQN
ncbi:hypothetical protein D3C73_1288400 [compost metagenome]